MTTKVCSSHYKGLPSIVLENARLRAEWLPECVAKLASLVLKHHQAPLELLSQSSLQKLQLPSLGACFADYDTSGFDECFPTIEECQLVSESAQGNVTRLMPDHGEVWAMPWQVETLSRQALRFSVYSASFGYTLSKTLILDEQGLRSEYCVELDSDAPALPYIWTPHALFAVHPDTELLIPAHMDSIYNVFGGSEYLGEFAAIHRYPLLARNDQAPLDLSLIEPQQAGNCEKYYFNSPLQAGDSFGFRNRYCEVEMRVDHQQIPYLGVWKNQGGFKGEYNFALEPCSGIYDSTARAHERGTCKVLQPGERTTWRFDIAISERE
ncbi:DUF4432 family protein [Aliagarivorans taiwanensis]|uniref:DUF4432 family protein n=1 Tax=Aliagarivorans taiwanensis TaxID=561966 RepID=UPI000407168C|nr:DUF4432 family protein [Aliagarivorans taiwanensis]